MINCILLSAGLSERFGSPKALAPINETTVIQQLQNALLQSHCSKIVVVLGAYAAEILPNIFIHSRISVVHNKSFFFGQTSSVQVGVSAAENDAKGFMILPVDCPLITTATINQVIEGFKKRDSDILIPTFQNKKGHPPIFHQRLKTKILELTKEEGLNALFAHHPPQTIEINDPGITKTFNTPEEFKKIVSAKL